MRPRLTLDAREPGLFLTGYGERSDTPTSRLKPPRLPLRRRLRKRLLEKRLRRRDQLRALPAAKGVKALHRNICLIWSSCSALMQPCQEN